MKKFEKRQNERFSLQIPSRLTVTGSVPDISPISLLADNISAGGIYYNISPVFPVDTEMSVDLILPIDELRTLDNKREHVKILGSVIRSDNKGLVVSFNVSTLELQNKLNDIWNERCKDPIYITDNEWADMMDDIRYEYFRRSH